MCVVAADTTEKLPDLSTDRLSPGYLCLEDCGITCLFTWYAVCCWATTKGIIVCHHNSYLLWDSPKIAGDQLKSTLFVSTIVPLHRVIKLIPPHVRHFLKRDALNILFYLDSTLGTILPWKLQWESGAARSSGVRVICCREITQQGYSLVSAQYHPSAPKCCCCFGW